MDIPRFAAAALTAFLMLSTAPAMAGKDPLPRKIFIAPVEMPKHPDIIGRGVIWAALLAGPVGAFASKGANNDIEAVYAEHLEKNHIDVASDITFELIEQLTARGFEIVSADRAEATLQVAVANYGLIALGSSGSIPHVTANFIVRDREGKRLRVGVAMPALVKDLEKKITPMPVTNYFENTQLLQSQMRRMNTLIISEGVKKF